MLVNETSRAVDGHQRPAAQDQEDLFSHRWRKSILLIIACRTDLLSSAGRAVSLWVAYPGLLPQNVHMQYDDDPAQAPDLMLH